MRTLRETLEWLEGHCHAAHWPLPPWRLSHAMVAGLGPWRGPDPDLEAALRHLEALDSPAIPAPRAVLVRPLTSRAPDNDGEGEDA